MISITPYVSPQFINFLCFGKLSPYLIHSPRGRQQIFQQDFLGNGYLQSLKTQKTRKNYEVIKEEIGSKMIEAVVDFIDTMDNFKIR